MDELAILYSYKGHNPYSLQNELSFLVQMYDLTQ